MTIGIASCSKDSDGTTDDDGIPPPSETLAEVVASGDAFENFPPNTTETDVPGTETTSDEPFDRKDGADL